MDKKRERSRNYTEREKFNLLEIVENYLHIIENKKTDNVNVRVKKDAWDDVAHHFNATTETGPRTGGQLKLLYDTIKKKVKRDKADEKVELYKTGGGKAATKLNDVGLKMLEISNHQICEMQNPYDSSARYDTLHVLQNQGEEGIIEENEEISITPDTDIVINYEFTDRHIDPEAEIEILPAEVIAKPRHIKKKKKLDINSEKENIKLKILKVRLEKEEIERDILILKKREMEINIMEKEEKLNLRI